MTQQPYEANVVLTADTSQYDQSLGASAQQTQALANSIDTLTGKLNNLSKAAGRKLVGYTLGQVASVTATTAAYAAFERQMTSLTGQAHILERTVSGQQRLFDGYAKSVNKLRDNFGATTESAAQLVQVLSTASDGTAPINKMSDSFERLGLVTGESSASLAYSMLQLQRTMGTPNRDVEKFNNQLAVLSATTGSSAGQILEFSQNIAPVGRLLGITQTDIQSFSSAFIRAGQDGYRASNTFNKMVSEIAYSAQSGSPDLTKYSNLVGMTVNQFKQLSGEDKILNVFESINRQGPRAISTLNQMGFDGMQTVKTITAMSQQAGGLREAVAAGRSADPNALSRGSNAVDDTLVNQMAKIRSEVAMTAEAMGRGFAPVSKVFVGSVQTMTEAARHLAESPLGKMAGIVSGSVAALTGFVGVLALGAAALIKFATANLLMRNSFTAGIRDAARMTPEARAGLLVAGNAGAQLGQVPAGPLGERISEHGNFLSRGMYTAGVRGVGLRLPEFVSPGPKGSGPGIGSRLAGYGLSGTALVTEHLITPAFMPGAVNIPGVRNTGGYDDYDKRYRFFKSATLGGAVNNLREGFQVGKAETVGRIYDQTPRLQEEARTAARNATMFTAASGGTGSLAKALEEHGVGTAPKGVDSLNKVLAQRQSAEQAVAAAAKRSVTSMTSMGDGAMSANRGLVSLGKSVGNLTTVMAATGIGLGRATGSIGKSLMGGLGLTGPLVGLMAGMALFTGYKNWQNNAENNYTSRDMSGTGVNPYIAAAGGVPIASGSSAFTLGSPSRPSSLSAAYTITSAEYRYSQNRQYQPKNTLLKGMDKNAAVAYLRGQFNAIKNDKNAVSALASDIGHYYPLADANWIMDQLQNDHRDGLAGISTFMDKAAPGTVDTTAFLGFLKRKDSAKDVGTQYDRAYATIADNAAYIGQTYNSPRAQNDAYIKGMASLITSSLAAGNVNFITDNPQTDALRKILGDRFSLGSDLTDKQLQGVGNGDPNPAAFNRYKGWDRKRGNRAMRAFLTEVPFGQYDNGKWNISEPNRANFLEGLGMNASTLLEKPRDVIVDKIMERLNEPYGRTTDKDSVAYRLSQMASGQVTQTAAFTKATNSLSGSPNAQFKAINETVSSMQAQGLNPAQINTRLNNLMATIGNPDDLGYKLLASSSALNQRNLSFQMPYMNRTQQFGAQTDQLVSEYRSDLGPEGRARRDNAVQTYQQQVMGQYDYFKQMLYQQREYEVMRNRAQDDYNLQRIYQEQDYNLQRKYQEQDYNISRERAQLHFSISMNRAQTDFNISRTRQEQDFHHQSDLMMEQSAKNMYNVYDRIQAQRVSSADYLVYNSNEQTQAIRTQANQLGQLRRMGLSNNAIKQMSLNDPTNAQQLASIVEEAQNNPELIKRMNGAIRRRLKAAEGLVTDSSDTEWTEFIRQYRLNRDRALSDFQRSTGNARKDFALQMDETESDYQRGLNRMQHQYQTTMGRQATAYALTMERSSEDLNRSAQTIDGNFEDILTRATNRLSGHAKKQARAVLAEFENLKDSTEPVAIKLMQSLSAIFGVDYTPPKGSGGGGHNSHPNPGYQHGDPSSGGGRSMPGFAQGGVLPGFTPNRDVHVFHSSTAGDIALSGGESIMRPEWTRMMGEKEVDRQNELAKRGLLPARSMGTYAAGGVYRPMSIGSPGGIHDSSTGFPAVDMAVPQGTPVHSVARGTVTYSGDFRGFEPRNGANQNGYYSYGRHIQIDHGPFSSLYAHLSQRIAALHQLVMGGQVVGLSGHTGYVQGATGNHLHFGVRGRSPLDFMNASTNYGGAGSVIGPFLGGFGGGSAVRQAAQDTYPALERTVRQMQAINPFKPGQYSNLINRFARSAYQQLVEKNGQPFNPFFGDVTNAPANVTGNKAVVKRLAAARGWTGNEWDALYQLVMHESGFRNTAQNPNSTAYGMFQFLNDTWAGTGYRKTSNPRTQTLAGLRYIASRYGDPEKAWSAWQGRSPHWYGNGAIFNKGAQNINVGERGPEMVLPLNDQGATFIQDILEKSSVGSSAKVMNTASHVMPLAHNMYNTYSIDKSTNFTGPITVQAQDPDRFVNELKKRQRRRALVQPVLVG